MAARSKVTLPCLERVLKVNGLTVTTSDVVDAARSTLVFGTD
jgi:hypothetical protein